MKLLQFITKPIVIVGGVLLGVILILRDNSSSQSPQTNQVNQELELAKLQAQTSKDLAVIDAQKSASESQSSSNIVLAQMQMAYNLSSIDAGRDITIAQIESDTSRYALATDLLKNYDNNSTVKTIALDTNRSILASELNAQNLSYNVAMLQTQYTRDIAFNDTEASREIALKSIDAELTLGLDNNATNRYLTPLELNYQNSANLMNYYGHAFDTAAGANVASMSVKANAPNRTAETIGSVGTMFQGAAKLVGSFYGGGLMGG